VSPCGSYLGQYTQQLLNTAISDAQGTYTEVSALSSRVKWAQTVVAVVCLVLGCVMAWSVLRLLGPVQQMIGASQEIIAGGYDTPDVPVPREHNEIGQLTDAFNRMKHSMAQQMNTLREKNEMERELHQQKTAALELQNRMERSRMQQLRSQIDPHFLFNTLNVILQTAGQEKAYRTQALITALSHLLRYSLMSNDEQVPLAREVRIVDEYYSIYHVRFWGPCEDAVAHLGFHRPDGDDGAFVYFAAHRGKCIQARHCSQGRGRCGAHPHHAAAGAGAAADQCVRQRSGH